MKNIFSSIALIFFITVVINKSQAQINVGSVDPPAMKPKPIEQEDIDALMKTKTAFVYGKNDLAELENWKKAMAKVWTITPIEFISYEKLNSYYAKPNYSFITISGYNTTVSDMSTGFSYDNTHLYLSLWMKHVNDKGKVSKKIFFRIELYPDFKTYLKVTTAKKEESYNVIYTEAKFFNNYPGLLVNSFKVANDCLKNGDVRWLFQTQSNAEQMSKVAADTLFMPDYILINFNKFNGDETKKMDEAKLMADYKNPYKFIPAKQLSDMILNDDQKEFYYLLYVKSSTDKYINVFNSKTRELLYTKYKPMSYNVNESDWSDLLKAIAGE